MLAVLIVLLVLLTVLIVLLVLLTILIVLLVLLTILVALLVLLAILVVLLALLTVLVALLVLLAHGVSPVDELDAAMRRTLLAQQSYLNRSMNSPGRRSALLQQKQNG
ncbi:hypothetical protein [Bordetella genomosp. 9]|uniref:hypothetical protein n=1 Tax=Bordetella genomosp. 9 TaxID=1416803 RepID=UPI0015C6245B|nr:hypothetical protein [Bordetella genomosp. 9]